MSNIKTVRYQNLGWETAADIYLPPGFDEQKQYPAIVSTHPIGNCKAQTAGNIYAKGLAEEGFVVLVHDASFQGASGGTPRFIEDPAIRVSVIRFAVDYLQSRPYVDANRIGAIGVCGGGAYTVHAGITDQRIKALVSITGVNYGHLIRHAQPIGHEREMVFQPATTPTAFAAEAWPQIIPTRARGIYMCAPFTCGKAGQTAIAGDLRQFAPREKFLCLFEGCVHRLAFLRAARTCLRACISSM